jgi:hypothetical protein
MLASSSSDERMLEWSKACRQRLPEVPGPVEGKTREVIDRMVICVIHICSKSSTRGDERSVHLSCHDGDEIF